MLRIAALMAQVGSRIDGYYRGILTIVFCTHGRYCIEIKHELVCACVPRA